MTVKELIEILQRVDPNSQVIMAKDPEGNGYSPLYSFWEGVYKAETSYYGEVGYAELTDEIRKAGYTEEDVIKGGVKAIILSPVN